LKEKRLAPTKGSTSELSIRLDSSAPLTFQDTGSVFTSVQQSRAVGMLTNTMTIVKLVAIRSARHVRSWWDISLPLGSQVAPSRSFGGVV
jgi:hypothetical protein